MGNYSNRDLFRIIPDPGRHTRITLSVESISTIPFQARTRYVKIPKWELHCSKHRMPCLRSIFDTIRATYDQANGNLGVLFMCLADIISNITNCGILWPGRMIVPNISQLRLVGHTNDCYKCRPSRQLIVHIPPLIAIVHLNEFSATFGVSNVHCFNMEVRPKWVMCPKEPYKFQKIPVV